jgi:DMSO reductase family type II enzyme chaperone
MTQHTCTETTDSVERLERNAMHLLQRAALFRLLALAFAEPRPDHHEAMRQLGMAGAYGWPTNTEGQRLLDSARSEWDGMDREILASEYARLFMRDCPCPPHETAYGDGCRMGGRAAELADISGFYQAFGLELSECEPDLPDHLCTELEFYSVLLLKTAYAVWHGRDEQQAVTHKAARDFLEQHLGRWVSAFTQRLEEVGCHPAYEASAALLDYLIREECDRVGVAPQPVQGYAGPAPVEPLTCPMACRQAD